MNHKLKEVLEQNKKWLYFALIAAFLWGMFAHGYCFLDNNVSHDSLNEFHGEIFGNAHKIRLGRILVPIYRDLLGTDLLLPWVIGVLSLFWIGLSVFLVLKIFRVESKVTAFLIAGIFTVNITVSSTAATYLHDLDSYMFSLLCAVSAVYLWQSGKKWWLLGALFVALSLGLYQSFFFAAVTLVMLRCILDLLDGGEAKTVFFHGLKAIGMLLLGGTIYYLALQVMVPASGAELYTDDYNTMDAMLKLTPENLPVLVIGAYQDWFHRLIGAYSSYPAIMVEGITAVLLCVCVLGPVLLLWSAKGKLWEKLLCGSLLILLPLGMNLIHVLTHGESHDLMVYPIWLTYLLVLLLAARLAKRWKKAEYLQMLCSLLVAVTLYGSAQFANGMYLKKDLEYDAYLSLMTRVMDRIEGHEGYVPGETPVVFVGLPRVLKGVEPGFKDYWNVTGMMRTDVIYVGTMERYRAYLDYVLNVDVVLAEEDVWKELVKSETVSQMPGYPKEDCVKIIDDTLVVKLGE